MAMRARHYLHIIVLIVGLTLIVWGLAIKTYGAFIVGLIVAGVNFRLWLGWPKRKRAAGN